MILESFYREVVVVEKIYNIIRRQKRRQVFSHNINANFSVTLHYNSRRERNERHSHQDKQRDS